MDNIGTVIDTCGIVCAVLDTPLPLATGCVCAATAIYVLYVAVQLATSDVNCRLFDVRSRV